MPTPDDLPDNHLSYAGQWFGLAVVLAGDLMACGCASAGAVKNLRRRPAAANRSGMRYISTRGAAPILDFDAVTLAGLASDGGLYVPEQLAAFSPAEIAAMAGPVLCRNRGARLRALCRFALSEAELRELLTTAYGQFRPCRRHAARPARSAPLAARTVPRADAGLQGCGDAGARPVVRNLSGPHAANRDDHRRDLGRYRLGGDQRAGRARQGRGVHAPPAWAGCRMCSAAR